jgi:hypothetical protein
MDAVGELADGSEARIGDSIGLREPSREVIELLGGPGAKFIEDPLAHSAAIPRNPGPGLDLTPEATRHDVESVVREIRAFVEGRERVDELGRGLRWAVQGCD